MADGQDAASLLRGLRQRQGKPLREAASELGVAPSQLSRMERGTRSINEEFLQRASDYYSVPPDLIELDQGRLPKDIIRILQQHPAEIDDLRRRYGSESQLP